MRIFSISPIFLIIYFANSWLVHLFINDAGDIDMGKEDPNGKLHYSVTILTLTQIRYKVVSHKEDVIMSFKSINSSTPHDA